ncbi:MAG TPA: hypothetical protein VK856_12985 [Anaerolineaceae bacterium]|nr:hypothetical protein [Anaerolineaceae bacterium]
MISGKINFLSTILFSLLFILYPDQKAQAQTIPEENNLSFVVFSNEAYYGLNAGSGNEELRFRFSQQNRQGIIYFDIYEDNQFFTFGAYNSNGIFILIQDHPDSNGKNRLLPVDFDNRFRRLLIESSSVYELELENIEENSWFIPEANILIADTSGNLILLHTHNDSVEVIRRELPYFSVTYLYPYLDINSNSSFENIGNTHPQLMSEIDQVDENFSIEKGFDVLTQFYPLDDRLASIMISPKDNQVYVSLDQKAEEIWLFDINGGTIETHEGFDKNHKANIPKLGITTSDLIILNFSNENLTVGIISIAVVILLIILIPSIVIMPKLNP